MHHNYLDASGGNGYYPQPTWTIVSQRNDYIIIRIIVEYHYYHSLLLVGILVIATTQRSFFFFNILLFIIFILLSLLLLLFFCRHLLAGDIYHVRMYNAYARKRKAFFLLYSSFPLD